MFINNLKKKISFETNPKFFQTDKVQKSLEIFNENVVNFFDELSNFIFKYKQLKRFPDLATFGFFCRKANIKIIKKKYSNFLEDRYGRGIVLHFTPSNVPLNFAYSLFFGLITGNSNIIRLSKTNYYQTKILIKLINKLLQKKKFFNLRNKINLIKYDKTEEITKYLCSICDVRLIWGGDNSINEIRKYSLPPNAFDVTFADKFSICIISANNYLKLKNFNKEAEFFYNDSLFFDQNACTSPKIVLWHGNNKNINLAKKKFWKEFENIVKKKNYKIYENWNYEKFYNETNAIINLSIKPKKVDHSVIKKIQLNKISTEINKYFSPGGFFFEYDFKNFSEIKKIFTPKVQTLTYIGFNPLHLKKKLNLNKVNSVDRIVPNGKSSEISLEWDGYDIVFQISKKLTII